MNARGLAGRTQQKATRSAGPSDCATVHLDGGSSHAMPCALDQKPMSRPNSSLCLLLHFLLDLWGQFLDDRLAWAELMRIELCGRDKLR